jgi:hypothetical protein
MRKDEKETLRQIYYEVEYAMRKCVPLQLSIRMCGTDEEEAEADKLFDDFVKLCSRFGAACSVEGCSGYVNKVGGRCYRHGGDRE